MHHNYAFDYVETLIVMNSDAKIYLLIEDANQRKWFGSGAKQKQQGAGAIKVICNFWKEWSKRRESKNVIIKFIHPIRNGTKKNALEFKRITGWTDRTNEHKRDAGIITYTSKLDTI